jgi:hypothetical protein
MKIRGLCLLIAAVGLLSPAGLVSFAEEPTTPTSPPVFYKELPPALEQEIEETVAAISQRSPLTPQEAQRAAELLASLNVSSEILYDQTKPPVIEFFRSLGIRAVPVLGEQLAAQDDNSRLRAIRTLRFLFKPRELREGTYEDTETALLALSERSLLDRSACVRMGALAILGTTALRAPRDCLPRQRAIRAIWSAVDDSEQSVSDFAGGYLVDLCEMEPPEGTDEVP